jgi:ABC-type phosphate/phosphonate transport system substrate-binding protein
MMLQSNRFGCQVRSTVLLLLLAGAAIPAVGAPLVFTAPPRESGENESDVYQPVADYLSEAIGKEIVYQHSDNWLTYQGRMRAGAYDLVFDGPHFLSWRMAKLGHEPLAKLPGKLAFVVVVRKENERIRSVKDLAGRTVCGMAPPNLATLTLMGQFDNPARQPLVVEAQSFKQVYENVVSGKCVGGAMRDNAFAKLDTDKGKLKVIYASEGVPNQAFSAGPRFTPADKAKLITALVAPEAKTRLAQFFERYNKGKDLLLANRGEYAGVAVLLKDTFGFDLGAVPPARRIEQNAG